MFFVELLDPPSSLRRTVKIKTPGIYDVIDIDDALVGRDQTSRRLESFERSDELLLLDSIDIVPLVDDQHITELYLIHQEMSHCSHILIISTELSIY